MFLDEISVYFGQFICLSLRSVVTVNKIHLTYISADAYISLRGIKLLIGSGESVVIIKQKLIERKVQFFVIYSSLFCF